MRGVSILLSAGVLAGVKFYQRYRLVFPCNLIYMYICISRIRVWLNPINEQCESLLMDEYAIFQIHQSQSG